MAITASESDLLDEIRRLRARVASLESESPIPKEIIEKAPVMISIVRAPDFVYELVNPAFQSLAPGKQFLGRRFAEVWAEISDPLVEILQNVIATGQTFHLEDAPYTIQRGPGMPPEAVYVTYSWIPLSGPDGEPDRVLTLAHEVTGSLRQRQQLTDSIAEIRRAEEALRESEERFRVAQELSPDGFLIFRPLRDDTGAVTDFVWIYENDAAARMNYTNPKEVCGKRVSEVLKHHSESPFGKAYKEVAETGEVRVVEEAFYDQDTFRQRRWFRAAAVPASGGDVAVLVQDVTERKRAEEELRESEAQFRTLANAIPQLCWMANADGWITWYNQRWYEYTGTTLEQMEGWGWQSIHDPAMLPEVLGRWKHSIKFGEPFDMVFPLRGADGVFRPFLTRIVPLRDQEGRIVRWFGTNTDISEQRRTEEALRSQAELLKLSFDAMIVWKLDSVIESWNIGAARLYGFSEAEALGRVTHDLLATVFPKPWDEIRRELRSAASWEGELRHRTHDGRHVVVSARLQLFRSADGVERVLEINRDITERKEAEEALRESDARERARAAEFEAILDSAPVAIFVAHDPECRDMSGSRVTCEMLHLSPGSNVSKSAPEGQRPVTFRAIKNGREIPPEDLPAQKAASTGAPVRNYEFDIVYEDGACRNMLGDAVPLFGDDGRPRGAVGAFVDITERKRAEDRFRQAQKLESVGLLAGGIAHDFNNLLTGVMGNASLLLEDAAPERADTLRSIIACTERAAHLTRQLLAYSGKGQFIVRELDITQSVNEVADLVQFSIPKSVSLAFNLERRLPFVAMDPGQLQQILMNLVINAGEAIGEGNAGRITVTTSMADVQSPFIDDLAEEIAPGRYVSIEVRDTGSGIDPEKKAKIFEPFFTTKFVGRGLGLAAIAGIVRSQKGGITVESAPGQGSTFTVFLPISGKSGPAIQEPGSCESRPVVLVVDDEAVVRDFIGAVLRKKGYQVVQASDGQEALAVVGSAPGAIGAAIVDIIMPNMSANDLLLALKAKQPGIRILLTSGYSEAEARRLCAAYPGAAFIQKPYTAQHLAKAVEEMVGASES